MHCGVMCLARLVSLIPSFWICFLVFLLRLKAAKKKRPPKIKNSKQSSGRPARGERERERETAVDCNHVFLSLDRPDEMSHTHTRWRDETKPPPSLNVNGVCGGAGDGRWRPFSLRSHLIIQPAVFPERAVGT